MTGTMGVLLKAKREGYIYAVKSQMKSLIEDGRYISQVFQAYVLEAAEEKV